MQKKFLLIQDSDVISTYVDTNDLIKDFEYKPNTSLEKGITEFVEWYKEFYFRKEN